MTILVAVKKNGRVYMGADRITTFGNEYFTDLVNNSKLIKLKNAYLGSSGYTLLDNVIEHLYITENPILQNPFRNRADAFTFFLSLYAELKKNYTLVDTGKDTYASLYNTFLLATATSIYGVSNNLSVHEHDRFVAKGTGADYALGCMYGLYDVIDDGAELTRLALEAACHYSIYCKEPIDVIEVKETDFSEVGVTYKAFSDSLTTHKVRVGLSDHVLVRKNLESQKDLVQKGSAQKELAQKGSAQKESAQKELAQKDPARENSKKNSAGKNSPGSSKKKK